MAKKIEKIKIKKRRGVWAELNFEALPQKLIDKINELVDAFNST